MFQSNLLTGKRILITGGGTGLGKSMGRTFLELAPSSQSVAGAPEVLEEIAREHVAVSGGESGLSRRRRSDLGLIFALQSLASARPKYS
jgi:short-subunit dehydrogenase involved in D-alanine esterification of teichoic acids